jgi:hypothetical protein
VHLYITIGSNPDENPENPDPEKPKKDILKPTNIQRKTKNPNLRSSNIQTKNAANIHDIQLLTITHKKAASFETAWETRLLHHHMKLETIVE